MRTRIDELSLTQNVEVTWSGNATIQRSGDGWHEERTVEIETETKDLAIDGIPIYQSDWTDAQIAQAVRTWAQIIEESEQVAEEAQEKED